MNMIVAEGFGDSSTVGIEAHSDLAHRSHSGSIPLALTMRAWRPRLSAPLHKFFLLCSTSLLKGSYHLNNHRSFLGTSVTESLIERYSSSDSANYPAYIHWQLLR